MRLGKRIEEIFNKHTKIILFIVTVVLFVGNISWYKIPWGGDSTFTIASGMYFAGYDWSSFVSYYSYYGFGYSILLAPLMFLIKDPILLYKSMLFCNVILYAVVVLIIYKILVEFFNIKNTNAFFAAISCIIWFPTLQQKDFVINETFLLVWVIGLVYFFLKMSILEDIKKRMIYSFFCAIIIGYGYNIHSRSLIFMIAIALTIILYACYTKKWIVSLKVFVPTLVIVFLFMSKASQFMQDALWSNSPSKDLANTMSTVVGKVRFFSYFTDLDKIIEFIQIFITNLLVYVYSTGGLFAFAFCVCIPVLWILLKNRKEQTVQTRSLFLLMLMGFLGFLGMIATISLSYVGILGEGAYSYKYLFYMRYAAPYGCIIWILFFSYIHMFKLKKYYIILGGLTVVAEYIWLNGFVSKLMNGLPYNFNKTMQFNIYRFASNLLNIEYFDDKTFMICAKLMLVFCGIFILLLLRRKFKVLSVIYIVLSISLYLYYNSLIANSINLEYLSADATIQYFQKDSKIDWTDYEIEFGGKGSYLCAIRYGLFDFDMEYVKQIEDGYDLGNKLYITNDISMFDVSEILVFQLDEGEFLVTKNENLYNNILIDYGKYKDE